VNGNVIFLIGAGLEIVGLLLGVSARAVAWNLITYGVVLLATGYMK